jgi:hypothetical protein
MKKCLGKYTNNSLQLKIAEEYKSRNIQKKTVVFVSRTIAHEKMAIFVGIVYTPPKKFQPAVTINPNI